MQMAQEYRKGCKKNTYVLNRNGWLLHRRNSTTKWKILQLYRNKDGEEQNKETRNTWYLIRQQGKKQENRTRGVDSHVGSRLCYEAEPGTLPHDLTFPSYSVSSTAVSSVGTAAAIGSPPPSDQINKNQQKLLGFGGCSNRFHFAVIINVMYDIVVLIVACISFFCAKKAPWPSTSPLRVLR